MICFFSQIKNVIQLILRAYGTTPSVLFLMRCGGLDVHINDQIKLNLYELKFQATAALDSHDVV